MPATPPRDRARPQQRSGGTKAPGRRPGTTASTRSQKPRPQPTKAQRAESARFRRSMLLVLISVVAPGSAQVVAGNRHLGKIALWVWAGIVAIVALVAWQVSYTYLIGLATHGWILTLFKVLATIVGVAWVVLIIDAWRLGQPPRLNQKHRLIMVVATVAVAALVSTPLVYATRYASAAHDAVAEMFPSGTAAAASGGRLNILLMGNDAGDDRIGVRPDSITLVSVDVRTGQPAMISLPRNLENAQFPDGTAAADAFPDGFSGEGDELDYMLNATWTYGTDHPNLFPDGKSPGAEAVKEAVAGTLGVKVHYYVTIDLEGFQDLVDAIGGVTIDVPEEIPIGQNGEVLQPGTQKLDGYHALWFARSRTGTSDYDRMGRQRCVLGAFLDEADPRTVLTHFTDLLKASSSIVETDIPRQELGKMVELALKAKDQSVKSVQFVPPLITPADPDFDVIQEKTDKLLSSSTDTPKQDKPAGDGDKPAAKPNKPETSSSTC